MKLNEKQQEIVSTLDGQVLVVACPGSGKTTAMVARTKNLVDKGVFPRKILVITFTKEAAESMQRRYEKEYGSDGVVFGTIHSICFQMLCAAGGYTKNDILLESEKWAFLSSYLYKKVSVDNMEDFISGLLTEISYIKNKCLPPEAYTPEVTDKTQFVRIYYAYEQYKKELAKIDFDDMLLLSRDLLKNDSTILNEYRKRYSYIMIDEYQDTNRVQAEIFYMLAGNNGNLCVVGDDDQSIYGFRSADSSIMLDFPKQYPACKTIYLDTNYRSGTEIIAHAGKLIGHNRVRFDKKFLAGREACGKIKPVAQKDALAQRDFVINAIKQLSGREHVAFKDMAILYRTNKQNFMYVQRLIKDEIPFYTTEAIKDYHGDFPFQDFMAYARLANGNPKKGDLPRILNRPSRYLKADVFRDCPFDLDELLRRCDRLVDRARARDRIYDMWTDIETLQGKNPKDFLSYLFHIMDYKASALSFAEYCGRDKEETVELINLLQEEAEQFSTMEDWAEYAVTFSTELRKKRKEKKGVCLSTYHSAKGLEWEHVFLIDCNEDITPFKKASTAEAIEEERRLFYVAFTRAKNEVVLTYVEGMGQKKMFPSRFLIELGCTDAAVSSGATGKSVDADKARIQPAVKKFYAVRKGKVPGIYGTWKECEEQVKGFDGAQYKRFDTKEAAELFINR